MDITVKPARGEDEEFLWLMIYYAAHMELDGAEPPHGAKEHPYVSRYVKGWGAPHDIGVVGYERGKRVGAVWSRLLTGDSRTYGYVDDRTPELAAAVLPEYKGKGAGTALLRAHLDIVKNLYHAITLVVRTDNPARRLYLREGFVIRATIVNRVGTESYHMIRHFPPADKERT
jgi:ribosomal protein S18 acetylase RimI-like enzyme